MQVISPSDVVPDWDDHVARLGEVTRDISRLEAERFELLAFMATVGEATGDRRTAAAEASCVLQVARPAAMNRMAHAQDVVTLTPVLEGLRTGRLNLGHAYALVEAGEGYAPELVVQVIGDLLESVEADAVLLPSELKRKVATRLDRLDPTVAQERREHAQERTEVRRRPDRDGLTLLLFRLPHLEAEEVWAGLTRLAEVLEERGDERPLAVRRSAALLGLLRGLYPDGIFRGIDVPVFDLDILVPLGLATAPVSVDGVTLTPEQAQQAIHEARRVRAATTDPDTGGVVATSRPVGPRAADDEEPERLRPEPGPEAPEPVDRAAWLAAWGLSDFAPGEGPVDDDPADGDAVDRDAADDPTAPTAPTAPTVSAVVAARIAAVLRTPVRLTPLHTDDYRPTARIGRYVRSRDETCTQPGCVLPAVLCDADHRRPWPLGPTAGSELDSRCRFDHVLKQSGGSVTRAPNGDVLWTTPDGLRTYRRPALLDQRPVIDRDAVLAALDRLRRSSGSSPPRPPDDVPSGGERLDPRRRVPVYVVEASAYSHLPPPPPPF